MGPRVVLEDMEDVAAFAARAEQWLRSARPLRSTTTRQWGEGEFDVTVFHDLELEVELRAARRAVAWHHEKFDGRLRRDRLAGRVRRGRPHPGVRRAFTSGGRVRRPDDHELSR